MIPPTSSNPSGHWELKEFVKLNDQLLKKFGGSWDHPPSLAQGWEADERLETLYQKASQVICKRFDTQGCWGWKDPRTSLTFPFWKKILSQLKSIICLRHPLDVARSLEARNGIPVDRGLELWLHYTRSAFENTSPRERVITCFENYFTDLDEELLKITSFVGLTSKIPWNEIRSFCRQSSWHYRTGAHNETHRGPLPSRIRSFYQHLLEEAACVHIQ